MKLVCKTRLQLHQLYPQRENRQQIRDRLEGGKMVEQSCLIKAKEVVGVVIVDLTSHSFMTEPASAGSSIAATV